MQNKPGKRCDIVKQNHLSPDNRQAYQKSPITHIAGNLNVQNIIDALPFYVLLVDEDHYILQANNAVHTHLKIKPEDIIGKFCPQAIHGLNEPFHGCPLEEAAEKQVAVIRELFDEDNKMWVSSAIFPTGKSTSEGKKIFFHMVTDITKRKQAEEQVKSSNERLRDITTHLESVREEERRRIARDLHDETSQILASLNAYLEAAVGTLPSSVSKTKSSLRKAQSLSVQILDTIQRLILELRPPLLDDKGLPAAINSLLSSLEMRGIKTQFEIIGEVGRYDNLVETALFRVVQESTNNIFKHSSAKNVLVTLNLSDTAIIVSIRDDGIGFEPSKPVTNDKTKHFGLLSMKERVELLNGKLKMESKPGQGTEIEAEIPLDIKGAAWEK
ncbi:ATP-binding protein [Chloroflexota bacterium]